MNIDYTQDPAVSKSVVRRHLAQNPDNCPHCGADLSGETLSLNPDNMIVCPRCGKEWSA